MVYEAGLEQIQASTLPGLLTALLGNSRSSGRPPPARGDRPLELPATGL